jgi:2-keto-3-deoxy-L-rhamnonate aldolase RhmA
MTQSAGLRERCGRPELKVGHMIFEFATPGIGQILKVAGCEFVLIDMEHSGFGYETVKATIASARAGGLPAIVRVPSASYSDVARACDVGADGIMAPMVSSAEHARAILDSMKYPPIGHRGVGMVLPHDRYTPGPTEAKLADANKRSALFAQIETLDGVNNAEAIAAIDGVDCLWVGHMDLSCSLGIPGQFEDPRFTGAVDRVLAACRKHGKSAGRLVRTAAEGAALHAQGFDFISYSGDIQVLQTALREGITALRAAIAKHQVTP